MNAFVLLLHHGIELGLLLSGEHVAHLCNGVRAQAVDLIHFGLSIHGIVLNERHCLLVLVGENLLQFGLLVLAQIQLVRKHFDLFIDV